MSALEKLRAYLEGHAAEADSQRLDLWVSEEPWITIGDLRRVEAELRAETLREFGCDLRDLAAEGHANETLGAVGSLLNRRIAETIKPEAAS